MLVAQAQTDPSARGCQLNPIFMPCGAPKAHDVFHEIRPAEFLSLHVRGQCRDISEEDRRENEYSLQHGFRLLSSYRANANETIWVVTESTAL